ncbi:hypothetical protein Tsp_06983 [Trichinella spiralis]|uniref:Uncharacterized protein n=1 Tax=Trichinella spiralis TaxID=6334 RepID=E5S6P8_TRISP|nr:hypothetical protein Tsp_06983 [Trichinella spiralis]KRY37833.1 hypothetical protein T01_11116 [Trichinella spiralis]
MSVGVAAGATDGCCRKQEQQRIKQKRRKSLDLLAVHTLLQKALANVDHYCLSKLVTKQSENNNRGHKFWADDNRIEWKKSDEASDQLEHDQAWLIDRPSMG